MAKRRLLGHNPLTGIKTWHEYDAATDTTTIYEEQDVSPILEYSKAIQNIQDNIATQSRNGHELVHTAILPNIEIMRLLKEEGIDVYKSNQRSAEGREHWAKLKRKLNDPSYRGFRTSLGRL